MLEIIRPKVLVTGATGFVGRHLRDRLRHTEFEVLLASRDPSKVDHQLGDTWVRCDLADPESVRTALEGVDVAYYLVHGMGSGAEDYARRERRWAEDFTVAAERAGLRRIVYLGGVAPTGAASPHLESRLDTGRILRASKVPTVELRAGMIIGNGSESWRIVRDLSTRLPVMILPRWLQNRSEPVALEDVVLGLVRAASTDVPAGVYGLPGSEVLTGEEILLRVARLRGTRPLRVSVPFVSPKLSSHWIRWVTRADPHIATELVQGMSSDLVSHDPPLWAFMPDAIATPFDDAAGRALKDEEQTLPLRTRFAEAVIRRISPRDA